VRFNLLILLVCLTISISIFGQIFWPKGWNGQAVCRPINLIVTADSIYVTTGCPIPGYFSCSKLVPLYNDSMFIEENNYHLNSKITYSNIAVGFEYLKDSSSGKELTIVSDLSTKFTCTFKQGRSYHFDALVASAFLDDTFLFPSRFKIELTNDSCGKGESVFISSLLDTFWRYEKVVFSPQDTDYDIIRFTMERGPKRLSNCFIDTLTPILPHNGNDVRSTMNDTVVKTPACFALAAHANISTYDTVYWKDSSGTILASGFDGGTVCPQASTYYVIAMRDSVPDCAGYWWSYDTVRITINPALDVKDVQEKEALQVYPTSLREGQALTIQSPSAGKLYVYAVDGKQVGEYAIQEGGQMLKPDNISGSQLLLLRFDLINGKRIFRKIILYK
jgi:hypothetical protein